jgi:hypothetical protein
VSGISSPAAVGLGRRVAVVPLVVGAVVLSSPDVRGAPSGTQKLTIRSVDVLTDKGTSVTGKDVEQGTSLSVAVTMHNEGPGTSGYVCTRVRKTLAVTPLTQDCKEIPGNGGTGMYGMAVRIEPGAPVGEAAITVDLDGGSGRVLDTAAVRVTVVAANRAPAPANPSVVVAPNTARTFTVAELAADPEGEAVTVAKGTAGPQRGTLTVSNDGRQITYQPIKDYQGPDSFQYIVTDSRKKTATGTVTVQVCSGVSCGRGPASGVPAVSPAVPSGVSPVAPSAGQSVPTVAPPAGSGQGADRRRISLPSASRPRFHG